jgi:hypothetical protein
MKGLCRAGTEIESLSMKIAAAGGNMKRNKRTIILAHEELTPLTEHILDKMGKEGSLIRKRLKSFYRERASLKEQPFEPPLEGHSCEAPG